MCPRQPTFDAEYYGLSALRVGPPLVPHALMERAHNHMDVEANLVLNGFIRYFVPNGIHTIVPDKPVVFWAGIPHRIIDAEPGSVHIAVSVPLSVFLEWRLPMSLVARMLQGEVLERPPVDDDVTAIDRLLFQRWSTDLAFDLDRLPDRFGPPPTTPEPMQAAASEEIRAWFRRLAWTLETASADTPRDAVPGSYDSVNRVARHVCEHYAEPLSVAALAEVAGLHPKYLMQLFHRTCGLRLWDYVQRVRIAHAQRLLATSSLNVLEVAMESGFGSLTQFNAFFKRVSELTPTAYRTRYAPRVSP